jgi:hypothetical protein
VTATVTVADRAPTVAHEVIKVGDPVYVRTVHGGRMAAVVTGATDWAPTGYPSDAVPFGQVRITARRPSPGYATGETVFTNDVVPRTGWHTSAGHYWRAGVSCLQWRPCPGCGRTTRVDDFAVELRHDTGTVTVAVTVINGDRAKAATLVLEAEGAPARSVESVALTRVRYV